MHREIGRTVRAERKAQGLSQQELGELAGTGLNFVSQFERGKATVRMDKALAVFKVLGLGMHLQRSKELVSVAKELRSE